ncbi:hypothetical protein LB505_001333 [Fusarium chuoi]|nr:hypothetical protein LB505_001333 [Fusarium chuoi]
MSYGGGAADDEDQDLADADTKADKEKEYWLSFKNEIIRIAHTLRLKGWRRIPLGGGDKISVERLSENPKRSFYAFMDHRSSISLTETTNCQSCRGWHARKSDLACWGHSRMVVSSSTLTLLRLHRRTFEMPTCPVRLPSV